MRVSCDDLHKHIIEHEIINESNTTTSDGATFMMSKKGRARNVYLSLPNGVSSLVRGILLPRNATVLAVVADSGGTQDWTLEIRKNDDTMSLFNQAAIGGSGFTQTANVDLDQGDRIQLFCKTTNFLGVSHPVAWIEIAWRI